VLQKLLSKLHKYLYYHKE